MVHHQTIYLINNSEGSSGFSSAFWGGLWGAVFAFIFGLITYIVTKRRERFIQHKNALVKLERVLNKHLDDLSMIEVILTDEERVLGNNQMPSNRPFELSIPDGLDIEIGSSDIVNSFLDYHQRINRLNFNVRATNHSFGRIEDLFIAGQTVSAQNFTFIKGIIGDFKKDVSKIEKRTTEFLAVVRIHLNKLRGKNSFTYGVFLTRWEQKITPEETSQELEKLAKEIEAVQKKAEEESKQ